MLDSHHGTDAAATHSGLELAVHLFDRTGGVKALSQQDDAVQEEERGNAIDNVLQNLNTVQETQKKKICLYIIGNVAMKQICPEFSILLLLCCSTLLSVALHMWMHQNTAST